CPTGATAAEQPGGGAALTAGASRAADASSSPAVATVTQQPSAGPTGATGQTGGIGPADAAATAVTDQTRVPAGPAGLADPTVAAATTVALEQSAGAAGLPRGSIGTVADQGASQ
ncbi:hypothetical protein NJB1604_38330, partial [Mycobacterium marinum]